MFSLAKKLKTLVLAAGFAAAGVATGAQAHTTVCGIEGYATAAPAVYDPFNPTGLQQTTVNLFLRRVNNSGGGDTRVVNFYLMADPATNTGADGTVIKATSVSGAVSVDGLGLDIFYDYNETKPNLQPITALPSSGNKFLKIDFTGNNAGSDTATATFQITLPPLANVEATRQLAFDTVFFCNIQGGKSNGYTGPGRINDAVKFPVTVLSALRASYQGTALDFGEIGQITTSRAGTKVLSGNYVRVESSGAYSVEMTSDNGYKLKKPGATTAGDEVGYKIGFLGEQRTPTATSPITKTCMRAGIGTAQSLPIVATLVEGGAGKNPSPTYSDYLTVTVTPLAYGTVTATNCPTL